MLRIILNDGQTLLNDPSIGWNLNSIEAIKETLNDTGRYDLYTKENGWQRLSANDIKILQKV
ncbi:hypothetical protein CHCC20491_1855 [Bacillus paralicheniformis]|uniref:hypothetical protein n=1 Tax=Bacillus TaxID=1386 RepID=UPI000429465B|nr:MULTISPECIES: hypothetical protein [Bacillus]MCU4668584.1 hypothetical protein [Bacillus paralicheniformis]TWK86642.1 hypothetical protein CHCC20333_3501 [Bacillus paralicheniformis]TWN93204.1 hypothetical protein CHCC20491_1855 [Bacillus paralicheniformis]